MSLSLMVSTIDQHIVWVSDGFADHVGVPTDRLIGRPIVDVLAGSDDETWPGLFNGAGSSDERFDGIVVHLVGDAEPAEHFEVRAVRSMDEGRSVLVSLRSGRALAQWESSHAFVTDVRAAMRSGDFFLTYQPIVDIGSGKLKKLEALARWTDPERGLISPDVFIPWAERTGVIDELGEWILDRACRDVVQMEAAGIVVDVSVNVSVVQLRHPDVSQRFGDVLARTGLAPERVWIEVTESVLLDVDALSLLVAIHSLGVRLVIDDFGTGHANFDYLTRIVVDALKIDTSFVAGLGTESRATAIVRSVIGLGRELGLEIVAEGIENEAQRVQLLDLKCRLGQGWLFSHALRYDELVARYRPDDAPSTADLVDSSLDADETMRLSAVRACRILDTDPEPAFDSLARLAAQLLTVPITVISLVDDDRQWFKACHGTDLTEVARSLPYRSTSDTQPDELPLIIGDTSTDDRAASNALVIALPHARSYAAMPIRSREGLPLGTFSVVDTRPRAFTPRELGQLALLTDQVSELLDLRRRTVELDDLYIGARHGREPARTVGARRQSEADAAPGNGALAELTRTAGRRAATPRDNVNSLHFDGLTLDLAQRTVTVDGQPLELPAREFDLLAFLAARPGQVFTRSELLQHVWNTKPAWRNLSLVTEHIHRLREKIDVRPNRSKYLHNVRGRGYSFQSADPQIDDDGDADSHCGTWVRVGSRIVAADDGMVALLGARTPADLIGRNVDDFVAPTSQPSVRAAREMHAAGIVSGARLITLLALDGTERLCLVSTDEGEFAGAPAVIGSAREIVDAPRLMRQMVSGVVAEVSDAVVVTDPDLRVLSWNPAAARLYGWSEQEVLGHSLHAVVGDGSLFQGSPSWDELHRNECWTGVVRQRARDGTTVAVASSVNLLREQGDIIGIAVVNRLLPHDLESGELSGDAAGSEAPDGRPSGRDIEQARLEVLGSCRTLDISPDTAFDSLTRLAARLVGTPIAIVSLIGRDRQFFVSRVGLEMTGTRRDVAFSSIAIATPNEAFIINDATLDERFADNPHVTGAPFIRAYVAIPILSREGLPFGTLTVIDTKPRDFTEQEIDFLKVLALQAAALLELRRRAGELDDLIGGDATDPSDAQLDAAASELSLELSRGAAARITRIRRRSLAATQDHMSIDPEASMLRLAAARSLLHAESVEEAVGVVIGLVRDLGGSTIPARLNDRDSLPLDCSFGYGEPLLARPNSVLARLRIERILPEVLDDARSAIGRLRERDDFAELSSIDPLTGLLNRRAVDELLTRLGPDDAVVIVDIDNFKAANDRWGHAVGDELLVAFARAMRKNCRPQDRFARMGGDELLALLCGAGRAGLDSFLERLHDTWLTVRPCEVTFSAGAALVGQRTGQEAVSAADVALYSAKAMGRDRVALDTTTALPTKAATEGTNEHDV